MIELLILLVVFCAVVWAARSLMAAFGIGDPIATVVYVVLVLIGLVSLLRHMGYGSSLL
jgi:hypothetical protein